MALREYVASFLGDVLANAVPHFVSGVCGRKFPSRLLRRRGRRVLPMVNVCGGV